MCSSCHAEFKAHFRVRHHVAIDFAVATDGECRKPAGAGLVHRLDNQIFVGRVLDAKGQAVVLTSGLFEDAKDGLH